MQHHDTHECDTHEHHGDEPGQFTTPTGAMAMNTTPRPTTTASTSAIPTSITPTTARATPTR